MPSLLSKAGAARGSLSRLLSAEAPRAIASSTAAWQKATAGKGKTGAAAADDDVVLQAFKEQQRWFRELVEATKTVPVPLTGDDAAIKKYADQMQALKAKIGLPEIDERINAELEYKLRVSRQNARRFVSSALEGVELGPEMSGVIDQVQQAITEIEAKVGPITQANKEGWRQLSARVTDIAKKAGLDNQEAVKQEAIYEGYKQQIADLKAGVVEEMESVKRKDGLEFVNVDLASLKVK